MEQHFEEHGDTSAMSGMRIVVTLRQRIECVGRASPEGECVLGMFGIGLGLGRSSSALIAYRVPLRLPDNPTRGGTPVG